MSFRRLQTIATALFTMLAGLAIAWPGVLYGLFALTPSVSGDVIARRAGALFLGIALLCWLSRNAAPGLARRAIALGLATSMVALAAVGLIDHLRGLVGPGIWLAIGTEIALAFGYVWSEKYGADA